MVVLILGLVLFLGAHSVRVVAPAWRERLVAERGAGVWKALYSAVSLVGLVLVVWGYGLARAEPVVLWSPPLWTQHLALVLMLPVFVLVAAAYLPGRIKLALHHPMLVTVKLWAVAHLLANGTLADLVLFGSLLAWAVAVRVSLKRRPAVPPAHGDAAIPRASNDVLALVLGGIAYVVVVLWLHRWLIRVDPL